MASSSSLLASTSSSLLGSRAASSPLLPRPRCAKPVLAPAATMAQAEEKTKQGSGYARDEQQLQRRRAVVFGAFASAVAALANTASADADEENKGKKNTCPKLCVQNRTASCCFGN